VKEYTDSEIIDCLRKRQSYVVGYLSARYMPMIKLMVSKLGGDAEDASDIFQDGLMILLEKIDNRNFALTCRLKTYLYCICENLWKDVLDKRRAAENYFVRREAPAEEADFTEQLDQAVQEGLFRSVFETLDQSSKAILGLYWQEMSPQEIADKLGFTYGYVRKMKSAAQAELTEKIKRHPDYRRIMNLTEQLI
jgi:RNA polymerase sigma factor (sigma-70 family)